MYVRKVLICVFAVVAAMVSTDSAHAQWRSRYMKRDGLFHVERYHMGNGLTPAGAGVFTTLITSAPGIIDSLQGRDLNDESENESSRAIDDSWREHYAVEQQSANNLLERTARLVGFTGDGEGADTDDPVVPPSKDRGTQTNEEESGKNPWPPRS